MQRVKGGIVRLTFTTAIIFSIAMFILGTILSFRFSRIEDKYSAE